MCIVLSERLEVERILNVINNMENEDRAYGFILISICGYLMM